MKKTLSAVVLLIGILFAILITATYLTTIGVFVAITALTGLAFQRYALDVWLGFDKFCNAAMGGSHLETISSRLGKSVHYNKHTVLLVKPIDRFAVSMLDFVDSNHCLKSIDWKVGQSK